ncbi:MAG: 30S ribosomal protein S2 [Candidatus Eisenbacteria bacterium]|nr:30S ribosomal protein S2 [Candidatus Eisenbacteria bacterium]
METTVKDLLDAGVHFGHQTHRWNPKMKPYIFMERNGIYIIDLDKSMRAMEAARDAVQKTVAAGELVLFVGTKKQAKDVIIEEAKRCKMFHVTERWLGGMLTNFQTIRLSIRYLRNLERMSEDGTMEKLSKKEAARLMKSRGRLEKIFDGIKDMHRLPGMVFILDTKREHLAVRECQRLGIPSIGIVDTNADPEEVTYPIPGNDDAVRAIRLYTRMVSDGVIAGQASAPPPEARPQASAGGAAATGGAWSSDFREYEGRR